MKINLERANAAFHFVATNESGNSVSIDASPAIGGEGLGARPMELLIMGLGGCSGIDVVSILSKQKQSIEHFAIEIDADREAGKVPSLFRSIHVHYLIEGTVEPEKARRAIELSLDKYCSAAKTLETTAAIAYSLTVNGVAFEGRMAMPLEDAETLSRV